LQLSCYLSPKTRFDLYHCWNHVTGDAVLGRAKEGAHQGDGLEAMPGVDHVVAGRVRDYAVPVDPVVLGSRGQVTHYLITISHRDPSMHLVT
jgi:hypothetical protein